MKHKMNNGGGVKKPKKPKMQTGGGVPKMPMSMLKKRHPMQKRGDAKKPKMNNGSVIIYSSELKYFKKAS